MPFIRHFLGVALLVSGVLGFALPANVLAVPATRPAEPVEPTAPPIKEYDTPTYYVIPLKGEVGDTFNNDLLSKALDDAATRHPTVVILEVDSPGGIISEVEPMIRTLASVKGLRVVAFVRQAISAAAITSLAVKEIYMSPGATFGAATAYKIDPKSGVPVDIEEKFKAIWLARARSAAEVGGYPSVFGEAMVDRNVAIYRGDPSLPVFSATARPNGSVAKPAGKLFIVTANEAVDYRLAKGIAQDCDALSKLIRVGPWQECEGLGRPLAKYWEDRMAATKAEMKGYRDRLTLCFAAVVRDYPGPAPKFRGGPERRRWEGYAKRCSESLKKAEAELAKLETFVQQHPELHDDADHVSSLRTELKAMRQNLEPR